FQSADEMAEQLYGVLREVVATSRGVWAPAASSLFGGDLHPVHAATGASAVEPDWRHLPAITVDPADAASSFVLAVTRLGDAAAEATLLREAIDHGRVPETAEARLSLARALLECGRLDQAEECLSRLGEAGARDWRGGGGRRLSLVAPAGAGRAAGGVG